MTLQDLFDALNAGELRLNFLADDDNGVVDTDNKRKLLSLTRRALTALHTRFDLRINSTLIPLVDGQESYLLDELTYPGLLKIERIQVEDTFGNFKVQPLNQKQNILSFQSSNYRSITLPFTFNPRPTEILVEYRDDHPPLLEDVMYELPEDVAIELPRPFLEPLVLYIAAKVHAGNGAADGIDMSTALQTQYEMACQKLENFNMDNDELEWRDAIKEDGWV